MNSKSIKKPNFLIIGAQKSGTSWLWHMLKQHPETSLPRNKEIHFFGSAELFSRGTDWYYNHFDQLDSNKVIGEASTTYFYDRVPYWNNESNEIEFDDSLPPLPELVTNELPDIKIIISLRDPVARAISAYYHCMKTGITSPHLGLMKVATEYPKMRILEYGYYEEYLKIWQKYVPQERILILLFEDEIAKNNEQTLEKVYNFLGLSPDFKPANSQTPINQRWTWSRILYKHYTKPISKRLSESKKIGYLLNRFDMFRRGAIKNEDIEFLKAIYRPRKKQLETVLQSLLIQWDT